MQKTQTADENENDEQQSAKLPHKADADADSSSTKSANTSTTRQQKLIRNADADTTKTKSAGQQTLLMPKNADTDNRTVSNKTSISNKDNNDDQNCCVLTALVKHATASTTVSSAVAVNAVTVHSETFVVAVAVEDGDGNNDGSGNRDKSRNPPKTRNKKQLIGLSLVISVVTSIALVVFFNLREKPQPQSLSNTATGDFKNDSNENSSSTTPEEDYLPSTIEYLERQSALIKILTPLVGDPRVFDPESPLGSSDRIAALEWLVATDPADLPIPVSDEKYVSNDTDTVATFEFDPTTTTTTTTITTTTATTTTTIVLHARAPLFLDPNCLFDRWPLTSPGARDLVLEVVVGCQKGVLG